MRKLMASVLPSASVPSVSIIPASMPLASRPKAVMSAQSVCGSVEGARKRIASIGAAPAHAYAAQLKHLVAGVESALVTGVGWLSNGSTFGTHVQTQATADSQRVDGRAGSPPQGAPPV